MTLLDLPLDVLNLIFGVIIDVQQAICLCLTDQLLFGVGIRRVMHLQSLSFNKGSGDRIICLGEHTHDDDYPPHIKSIVASHLSTALNNPQTPPGSSYWDVALRYSPSGSLSASTTGAVVREDCDLYAYDPAARKLHCRMLASPERCAYQNLIRPTHDATQPWALCNLSKGIFVRADALALLSGPNSSPPTFYGHGGLAEVLLFRIAWSSDPSTSMAYQGEKGKELHRGAWAGDRIEITTVERMRTGIQWKDGSEEALREMIHIWRSQMGEDWLRERLARYVGRLDFVLRDGGERVRRC